MKVRITSLLSALLLGALVQGVAAAANVAGQVTHLSGVLTVRHGDGTSKMLSVKSEIWEGDTLTTEKETFARIKFIDNAEIVLRPGSQLKVASYSFNQAAPEADSIFLSMFKGGMRAVSGLIGKRNRDAVKVTTKTATIGIRGTNFGVLLCQEESAAADGDAGNTKKNDCEGIATTSGESPETGMHVDVSDGAIVVKNEAGEQLVGSGQFGFVRNIVTLPVLVPPQQGIQVTMPTRISENKRSAAGVGKGSESECVVR